MQPTTPQIVGIYDANSTLWGEVSYWIGARLGQRHCSLCEVTHGVFRRKSEWDACAAELPFPFVTYHRNDMPPDLHHVVRGQFPTIVLDDGIRPRVLLTDSDISRACGSPQTLAELIKTALSSSPNP